MMKDDLSTDLIWIVIGGVVLVRILMTVVKTIKTGHSSVLVPGSRAPIFLKICYILILPSVLEFFWLWIYGSATIIAKSLGASIHIASIAEGGFYVLHDSPGIRYLCLCALMLSIFGIAGYIGYYVRGRDILIKRHPGKTKDFKEDIRYVSFTLVGIWLIVEFWLLNLAFRWIA